MSYKEVHKSMLFLPLFSKNKIPITIVFLGGIHEKSVPFPRFRWYSSVQCMSMPLQITTGQFCL